MLVITAPGQGAQAPGFLSPWLELPGFADRLGAWSELAGVEYDERIHPDDLPVILGRRTNIWLIFQGFTTSSSAVRAVAASGSLHWRHSVRTRRCASTPTTVALIR